jgi:hypothetical protein
LKISFNYTKDYILNCLIDEEVWNEMKNYIENEINCKIEVKSLFRDKINTLDESNEDLIFQILKMPKFNSI